MTLCYVMIENGWRHTHLDREEGLLDLTTAVMLRDPMDRFKSAYNYPGWHMAPGPVPPPMECIGLMDGHFAPQSWFLEGLRPDFYGDVSDMESFIKKLGLPWPTPWRNPQWADRFEKHRTPELEAAIINFYGDDYLLRKLWL